MRYVFLGDRLTRPDLAGRPCDPVRRPDGRVVRGHNRNALPAERGRLSSSTRGRWP
ncbi:MAG TPA: hypothetical protein VK002_03570 [Rubricoccaceae bacterium]|nr:hypothetical protein [Rubricoccaceae bacterium]